MSKQITVKQHFAPRFYFKRFADDNWLQAIDLRHGKIIKPQTYPSVCYAPFYYALETGKEDEISQEFEEYFQSIEDMFAVVYDDIIEAVLDNKQVHIEHLHKLAWFTACLWLRSPVMRQQINDMSERATKQIIATMASYPDFTKGAVDGLAKEGVAVTEAQVEEVAEAFRNEEYSFELTNGMHLNMIAECEQYARWFFAKNWRFYIAKSSKQFITSDTPVIELYDTENRLSGNHIMQRRQFFALTPNILIELVDPTKTGKKIKRQTINDTAVEQYNLLRARYSKDYCYARSKSDIEDLLSYYEGGLAVKQAVSDYMKKS